MPQMVVLAGKPSHNNNNNKKHENRMIFLISIKEDMRGVEHRLDVERDDYLLPATSTCFRLCISLGFTQPLHRLKVVLLLAAEGGQLILGNSS